MSAPMDDGFGDDTWADQGLYVDERGDIRWSKWDSRWDCDKMGFTTALLSQPACWFGPKKWASCGTKGLCALTGVSLNGSELQAGFVLGFILLVHLILLSVCLVRLAKVTGARFSGYTPQFDKSIYQVSGRREACVALYALVVTLWCLILGILNRGHGQFVGSMVALMLLALLMFLTVLATKYCLTDAPQPLLDAAKAIDVDVPTARKGHSVRTVNESELKAIRQPTQSSPLHGSAADSAC